MLVGLPELQVVVPGPQELLVVAAEVAEALLVAAGVPFVPGQVLGEEGLLGQLFGFGLPVVEGEVVGTPIPVVVWGLASVMESTVMGTPVPPDSLISFRRDSVRW
ncbi:UNVERIFIED_CONTAM: hypothetical protein K2H54_000540 [Gekko kuhli]